MEPLHALWTRMKQPFLLVRTKRGDLYLIDSDTKTSMFRAWSTLGSYTMVPHETEVEHVPCTLKQLAEMMPLPEVLLSELRSRLRVRSSPR